MGMLTKHGDFACLNGFDMRLCARTGRPGAIMSTTKVCRFLVAHSKDPQVIQSNSPLISGVFAHHHQTQSQSYFRRYSAPKFSIVHDSLKRLYLHIRPPDFEDRRAWSRNRPQSPYSNLATRSISNRPQPDICSLNNDTTTARNSHSCTRYSQQICARPISQPRKLKRTCPTESKMMSSLQMVGLQYPAVSRKAWQM